MHACRMRRLATLAFRAAAPCAGADLEPAGAWQRRVLRCPGGGQQHTAGHPVLSPGGVLPEGAFKYVAAMQHVVGAHGLFAIKRVLGVASGVVLRSALLHCAGVLHVVCIRSMRPCFACSAARGVASIQDAPLQCIVCRAAPGQRADAGALGAREQAQGLVVRADHLFYASFHAAGGVAPGHCARRRLPDHRHQRAHLPWLQSTC